jgi:hypothetical protein
MFTSCKVKQSLCRLPGRHRLRRWAPRLRGPHARCFFFLFLWWQQHSADDTAAQHACAARAATYGSLL